MAKLLRSEEISIPVYLLVILFGSGSWVAVNGLWVELPLLVQDLPEAWNLPSFLVIIIQLANIGPIAYSLARKCCKSYVSEKIVVYLLVLVGIAACLLLAFLWRRTLIVAGNEHSVVLFILAFFLATVDCTSSVVFLPFMSRIKSQYLTAFFIGEGLSGLIPSLVALAQGAGGSDECVNKTITNSTTGKNETILVPLTSPPNFSVSVFFFFLAILLVLCGLAFILLNYLPLCKKEHVKPDSQQSSVSSSSEDMKDRKVVYKQVNSSDEQVSETVTLDDEPYPASQVPLQVVQQQGPDKSTFLYLLLLTAWVNAMSNGLLPSIQSYSALPYGNTAYHLAVTLGSIANPLTCFLLFLVPSRSKKLVTFLTIAGTGFLAYIFFMAAKSPTPPLHDQVIGRMMMVTIWIINTAVLSCVKVTVAAILRQKGQSALFWYGATEQVGSALGAMISFVLVNVLHLFQSKAPCT